MTSPTPRSNVPNFIRAMAVRETPVDAGFTVFDIKNDVVTAEAVISLLTAEGAAVTTMPVADTEFVIVRGTFADGGAVGMFRSYPAPVSAA